MKTFGKSANDLMEQLGFFPTFSVFCFNRKAQVPECRTQNTRHEILEY